MNFITHERNQEDCIQIAALPSFYEVYRNHIPTRQGHNYNPLQEWFFDFVRLLVKEVFETTIFTTTHDRLRKK